MRRIKDSLIVVTLLIIATCSCVLVVSAEEASNSAVVNIESKIQEYQKKN